MNEPFLMLARRMFGHHLWLEPRVFSRAEAWLDLLQTAAYAPHKRMISGHTLEIPRGGLVASVRWLCDRWGWSNTKVCLFLDVLEAENMITREKRQGNTLLRICKYDVYNIPNDAEATGKRRKDDTEATAGRRRDDEIEEEKEGKKNSVERSTRAIRSWEHVKTYAITIGLAEWKAQDWFDEMEACGWMDWKSKPVLNWRAFMRRVKIKWEKAGRPSGPPGINGKPAQPKSKYTFVQPLYDDEGRMIRNAHGKNINPDTGEIIP